MMFREVSGGVCNPAIALAKIIWQSFTLEFEHGNDTSSQYWSKEYMISFFIGPIVGALAAGVSANIMRDTRESMRIYP